MVTGRSSGITLALAIVFTAVLSQNISGIQAAPVAWNDNATGFAIGGYDPVAYFSDQKAMPGQPGLEHSWGARVWRFINQGNRDAFAKHPQVYLPRFAGYDAEALARGLTVEGSPIIWAVYRGRIFLFRDAVSLTKWRGNTSALTSSAEANWKHLSKDLPGTSQN